MHDPNGLVARAMTASVCSRLVERAETVCATPQPRHQRTPTMESPTKEPAFHRRFRTLRTYRRCVPLFPQAASQGFPQEYVTAVCTTMGSSRVPRRRSSGTPRAPALRRNRRARRGVARGSSSGTGRGTARCGHPCADVIHSGPRLSHRRSRVRRRGRSSATASRSSPRPVAGRAVSASGAPRDVVLLREPVALREGSVGGSRPAVAPLSRSAGR
jgi:hypothetical protein